MLRPSAKASGAFVIEINLAPTLYAADTTLSLQGRAKDLVPLIL